MKNEEKDNYLDSFRKELIYLIERELSPLAHKYQYSDTPLESKVKWKPIVLVLGSYSSGKSTFINELIGSKVQKTGQAPTDDCFTVLTSDGDESQEESDSKALLYDDQYPFEHLKKHGERFASHFRLKKISQPAFRNFAIIDTPGLMDAVSESERGYDFQAVIADLAAVSDLIIVLFDPHKTGTIRESYVNLSSIIPEKTFEDRLIFVLNRIDECNNLEDLFRVYGTLCWNLSAISGKKDIPKIFLNYSALSAEKHSIHKPKDFLESLFHNREELRNLVFNAPKHRVDHLASFVEYHGRRLSHYIEGLTSYVKVRRKFYIKMSSLGGLLAFFSGGVLGLFLHVLEPFGVTSQTMTLSITFGLMLLLYSSWQLFIMQSIMNYKERRLLAQLDEWTSLKLKNRQESWDSIRDQLSDYIHHTSKLPSLRELKKEQNHVQMIYSKGVKEIRSAINGVVT